MGIDLIVIGGGASGMMAALVAAREGAAVLLIEKNRLIGRKLAITGGGRCNLTNQAELPELIANIPGNGRFLYSALQRFGSQQLMEFFEIELGVKLKVERGRRVFPYSDQAKEVIAAFQESLQKSGARILTSTVVKQVIWDPVKGQITVKCSASQEFSAFQVIVATGGLAYPGTGSTGDGYAWAAATGHRLVPCYPSLVPLEVREDWPGQLEGLSLVNVRVTASHQGKKLAAEFGEMLFTSYGVSGPLILSMSRQIVPLVIAEPNSVVLEIDLKPALSEAELDQRVQRDFSDNSRKLYKNALDDLLPQKIIPVVIELSGIDPLKPVHQITRAERQQLVKLLKQLRMTVSKPRSYAEAIITTGGVNIKDLDPKTMESKLVPGLYFVGEVVDVDAYTGGYNLQVAFAMGYVAAKTVAQRLSVSLP